MILPVMAKEKEKKGLINKLLSNKKVLAIVLAAIVSVFAILFAGIAYFAIRLLLTKQASSEFDVCVNSAIVDEESCKEQECGGLVLRPKTQCLNSCEEEANIEIGECYRSTYLED